MLEVAEANLLVSQVLELCPTWTVVEEVFDGADLAPNVLDIGARGLRPEPETIVVSWQSFEGHRGKAFGDGEEAGK